MVWYKVGVTYKEAEKAIGYIPKRYYKYKKLWNEQFGERLLKYALQDYAINLKLGISLRFFLIYKLTETEQQVLKEFVRENLQLGRIRFLQLLVGYLILFIPKKNGKLRICINYRQLNSIIKKDRYPLPLISEIQDRIGNTQIFLKINLRQAYYQIRIKKGDK